MPASSLHSRRGFIFGASGLFMVAACGSGSAAQPSKPGPMGISAIPDQKPEKLNRLYPLVADRVAKVAGVPVSYKAVTDYPAVIRAFEIGDVYLVWMGGLTGVQARSRVPGARAIVQRDIDAHFHSLFIANRSTALTPFTDLSGLKTLAGHTFTFGSETSTSGRLMPQYFMGQGGLDLSTLKGKPGFSGSHDATIADVANGSFEVGAVNEQVWTSTVKAGKVDLSKVVVLFRTPEFADYHWLVRPDVDKVFGAGTTQKITDLLLGLTVTKADDKAILDLFGATTFIATSNSSYDKIESVAKELGLLT